MLSVHNALMLFVFAAGVYASPLTAQEVAGPSGTTPLTIEGDLASQMVDGIDRFLLKEIETTAATRAE